jgi:thymidylate kinase
VIVGIEGPVLAGKSSLARHLVKNFTELGVSVASCPCYVEMAKRLGRPVPPGLPGSPAEQLQAMRFFLDVDGRRRPAGRFQVVVLDRTTWTLEAHAAALVSIGAIEVAVEVDDSTRRALYEFRPDVLVYLDVPWAVQLDRAPSRDVLPPPFLDRAFNTAFREFFEGTATEHRALWLDATRPLSATTASVVDYLRTIDSSADGPQAERPSPCPDDSSPGTESSHSSRE